MPALAQLFLDEHVGCIPIIDERGRPHGIVTKSDVVGQLSDDCWSMRTARDVMMPLALTLDEHATLAHAASMMTLEDLHHVMVVSCSGALIGIVSAKDVVRTRLFVTDISRWEEYGLAHGEVFGEIRPAMAMIEVKGLIDPEMLVEIEADAVVTE